MLANGHNVATVRPIARVRSQMILSDKTIREELDAGRIVIDPLGEGCIQPSSVDLHVDRYFRVFLNHTQRVIDVKDDQENLTELVEVPEEDSFILHPGNSSLGRPASRSPFPPTSWPGWRARARSAASGC